MIDQFVVVCQAGLNASPLASIAQAMRAFFAAIATTAFQYPRRSASACAQRLMRSCLPLAAASTARAPRISSVRK